MTKLKDSTRSQLIDIILRKDNVDAQNRNKIKDLSYTIERQANKINDLTEQVDNLKFDKDALKIKNKRLEQLNDTYKWGIIILIVLHAIYAGLRIFM